MHETTFYEHYIEPILFILLSFAFCITVVLSPLYYQYRMRKKELDQPKYRFKDYIKWLMEGLLGDIWKFLRVLLIIAGIGLAILLIYLSFMAVKLGIDSLSVKDVLVVIAFLLVLLLFKNVR